MAEYRLAAGHITASALMADVDYIVENFPTSGGYPWVVGTDGVISTYSLRTQSPAPFDYGNGLPSLRWTFSKLSRGQFEYLMDTVFAGQLSAAVTLMTWRFNNQSATGDARNWVILQAYARIISGQISADTTNTNDYWYKNVSIDFIRGQYLVVP